MTVVQYKMFIQVMNLFSIYLKWYELKIYFWRPCSIPTATDVQMDKYLTQTL